LTPLEVDHQMICSKCNQNKSEAEFSFKNKKLGKRNTVCVCCKKAYAKAHYKKHKEDYIRRSAAYSVKIREENSKQIADYLRSHPCVDCNEPDIVVLQFDHQRDKTYSICELISRGSSWKRISNEITKCEVRCANCHIRRTAKAQKWKWKT
jgi:hypothetical protein